MTAREARQNRALALLCILTLVVSLAAYEGVLVAACGLLLALAGWTAATADSYARPTPREDQP